MSTRKYQLRLQALFLDLERLAKNPEFDTPALQLEIGELRARLVDLQTQFLESEARLGEQKNPRAEISNPPKNAHQDPIFQEKDRVEYVFANDESGALPDPNLTSSGRVGSVSVPLMASDQILGELRVGSRTDHALSSEELSLANGVAKQVSLQVQNLRLLAATNRARA